MRWILAGVAVLAQLAGAAGVQAQTPGEPVAEPRVWGVALTEENDFFDFYDDNSDRYYTQGVKLSVLSWDLTRGILPDLLRDIAPLRGASVYTAAGVGQHMYTPEDLLIPAPDPQDRPYAGWAYLSSAAFASDPNNLYSLEAQLGVVGPSAHAGEAQNGLHRLKEAAESLGWDHQLKDEPGFNLYAEHRRKLWGYAPAGRDKGILELLAVRTLAIGTVETSVGAGFIGRIGYNLGQDFGPQRLRPGAAGADFFEGGEDAFYFFGGVHARAVVHDVFLDGNVFRDSPSVDKKFMVPEWTLGVTWTTGKLWYTDRRMPPIRISYAHVWQGEQFMGQNGPLEYGSLTFAFTTAGLSR